MNYALLALLALLLLGGLVAFGIGHKRWSIGSVVGAVLVLLAAAGYLSLAARLAAFEWSWANFIKDRQVKLARVRDAQAPKSAGGVLIDVEGEKPLAALASDRDRWQSVLERIDTWRERHWDQASFLPPQPGEGGRLQPGRLELPAAPLPDRAAEPVAPAAPAAEEPAAEGGAEPAEPAEPAAPAEPAEPAAPAADREPESPIDPGTKVYVVDDAPAEEGGRYLGEFLVQAASYDKNAGRFILVIEPTAPADDYDTEAWKGRHDAVTVFEDLPVDRWLGFTRTPKPAPGDGDAASQPPVLVEPPLKSIEDVEAMLQERDRHEQFLADLKLHGERIEDKEKWREIREAIEQGDGWPGQYWATVKVKEPFAFETSSNDEDAKRTFEADEDAEFDLATAFKLEEDGKATVTSVRRRRLLRDARTLLHGASVPAAAAEQPGGDGESAGIASLVQALRRDIAALDASNKRLEESRTSVGGELGEMTGLQERLAADMTSWKRDADVAAREAERFEAAVRDVRDTLSATERTVVDRGRELTMIVGRLVSGIDERAPAADRPADTR